MILKERIGILAVQETHLNEQHLQLIDKLFGKWILVVNSEDDEQPTASAGVAFVVNRKVAHINKISTHTLKNGRALYMSIEWHNKCVVTLLNIYTPNEATDHPAFWEGIESERIRRRLGHPDMMLGDFNLVEDSCDRAPPKPPHELALASLIEFRTKLGLTDGWRETYPFESRYTFRRKTVRGRNNPLRDDDGISHSRLDRIYTQETLLERCYEWNHMTSSVPTDHDLTTVRYAPRDTPSIGKGRATMPLYLSNNRPFMRSMTLLCNQRWQQMQKVDHTHTEGGHEVQRIFQELQQDIKRSWMKRSRTDGCRMAKKIQILQKRVLDLTNHPDFSSDGTLRMEEAILNKEIKHIYKKKRLNAYLIQKGVWLGRSENISKEWLASGDEKRPRDVIYRLAKPREMNKTSNHRQYTTRTNEMLEIAINHHERLQEADINEHITPRQRKEQIDQAFTKIPNDQRANDEQQAKLSNLISQEDVEEAIRESKIGKAAGMSGIPSEFWKEMLTSHKNTTARGKRSTFDVVAMMTRVFNCIQEHGTFPGSRFTLGWMCPIHKKGEKEEISNYRPITVLNSEYKLLTTALTKQLTRVAKSMIHPDQAGFMTGRRILDQIELSKTMIAYAEASEINGVIIALDQEKAYDRIRHDYLLDTLRAFGIPDSFVTTIQHLYSNAETQIVINGTISRPFQVKRGVRQGDPLSCLLFNLAIEPLACALRNANNIDGYSIPGIDRRVLVALFADDATVYLTEKDKFSDLQHILDKWCEASGAKFNISKTEILPIGSTDYRASVVQSRRFCQEDEQQIASNIRVIPDGESMRSLGAQLGNNYKTEISWRPTINKVTNFLNKWKNRNVTFKGKRHLVQISVGGMTQYRTAAQGMPPEVVEELRRLVSNFLWGDGKRPQLAVEQTYRNRGEGGLGVLDIDSRNRAIDAMRLQRYLDFGNHRPTWAFVLDQLITLQNPAPDPNKTRSSAFLQDWKIPRQGKGWAKHLPESVHRMLEAARTMNVRFEALKLSPEVAGMLPAWHHIGLTGRKSDNEQRRCLFINHKIRITAGLERMAGRNKCTPKVHEAHSNRKNCKCQRCTEDRSNGCEAPNKCVNEAEKLLARLIPKLRPTVEKPDGLSLTRHRKLANKREAEKQDGVIVFDPSITLKTDLGDCIRIFTDPTVNSIIPASRLQRPMNGITNPDEAKIAFTDGSSLRNGTTNASCGAGIWFGPDDPLNMAFQPDTRIQDNNVGELASALKVLQIVPNFAPLTIRSDSKVVIEGLTKHLPTWEDIGWTGINYKELFQATAYRLRVRSAPTMFQWVKGHSGIEGNEAADELAGQGARSSNREHLDLGIPPEFHLTGAKLRAMTQKLIYAALRERAKPPDRPTTERNITRTQQALANYQDESPLPARIWRSIQHPDLGLPISQFLFRIMHNIQKVGDFWRHSKAPDRARCTACNAPLETPEHIIIDCPHPTRRRIWEIASRVWPYENLQWPDISFGLITGCGLISASQIRTHDEPSSNNTDNPENNDPRERNKGASRLLRILISESAFLIWKLRNERVLDGKNHNEETVESRWKSRIEDRMNTERAAAATKAATKRNTTPHENITQKTWEHVIANIDELPHQWSKTTRGYARLRIPHPREV